MRNSLHHSTGGNLATRSELLAWIVDLGGATEEEIVRRFGSEAHGHVASLREVGLIRYGLNEGGIVLVPVGKWLKEKEKF